LSPSDKAARGNAAGNLLHADGGFSPETQRSAEKKRLILGVSGGLDSTLALLVAVKTWTSSACRALTLRFYLPGFGTTAQTKANATNSARFRGTLETVSIARTAKMHLKTSTTAGITTSFLKTVQARYRHGLFVQ